MTLPRFLSLGLLALAACATPSSSAPPAPRAPSAPSAAPAPQAESPPAQDTYGLVPENAVPVGGGPAGERAYLRRLRGPRGEPVTFEREGSCCGFKTPNGFHGQGLLDMYEITYEGLEAPVLLYLNMYDAGPVRAPPGFRLEGEPGAEGPGRTTAR